eukprot:CCRYP_000063-RA/>CCRYP_000063-RA protein AED:0.08 eAED:0.08 QI:97/1/1/1/1/1/2/530/425
MFMSAHFNAVLLTSASHRLVSRRHPLLMLLNRRSILVAMTTTASSFSLLPSHPHLQQSIDLLNSVYGPVDSHEFPRPMSRHEAGPCFATAYSSPHQEQRRYLWTDAFAVCAYHAIANIYAENDMPDQSNFYRNAVEKLILTVHSCLGRPRSEREEDAMTPCHVSPTGYVGLRIGKVESRSDTDYGMTFDGQYFHYIDKWLLALSRTNHVEDGLRIAKSIFPHFFEKRNGGSGGVRWKLSVNARPPSALPPTFGPNDDTLNALIVFTLLETQRQRNNQCMPSLSLSKEIETLQDSLRNYRPRVTDDPLGWGLEAIFDQFVEGHPRTDQLRNLASEALDPSHIALPFRLYGALIGATVSSEDLVSSSRLEKLRQFCIQHQLREMERTMTSSGGYEEEHSAINRVMLAVALLGPGTLRRTQDDQMVQY